MLRLACVACCLVLPDRLARVSLALLVAVAYAAGPSPVVWPSQWNATWNFVNTSNGAVIDGPNNWFYDAKHGMLRQDNRHNCDSYKKNVPCSAVFRGGNMYYNIPAANFCCLCYKNLLPTGTNWLSKATFVGLTKYNLTNTAANLWTFSNNTQFYYETAAYRLPLALSGFGTDLQWLDVITGAQNPFVFSIPSNCTAGCPSSTFPQCGSVAPPAHVSLAAGMLYGRV